MTKKILAFTKKNAQTWLKWRKKIFKITENLLESAKNLFRTAENGCKIQKIRK